MGLVFRTIEPLLGWMLSSNKNHDAGLFTKSPAVSSQIQTPHITVSSPDCGPSGSALPLAYASSDIGGTNKMVSLSWSAPRTAGGPVTEYLVVIEDPDSPSRIPFLHGLYYQIPSSKTSLSPADFEVLDPAARALRGGFHYGANAKGSVYAPPRPLKNGGVDRYVFSVVALSERLELGEGGKAISKEDVLGKLGGKVMGWGQWVGTYENVW